MDTYFSKPTENVKRNMKSYNKLKGNVTVM